MPTCCSLPQRSCTMAAAWAASWGLRAGRARQAALAAGYELHREGGAAYSVPTGTEIEVFRKVGARRMRTKRCRLPPPATTYLYVHAAQPVLPRHARPAASMQPRRRPGMHTSKHAHVPDGRVRVGQAAHAKAGRRGPQVVEDLPAQESPELFGMHANADLTFRTLSVQAAVRLVLDTRPQGGGGGGGLSREDAVDRICEDLLHKARPRAGRAPGEPGLVADLRAGRIDSRLSCCSVVRGHRSRCGAAQEGSHVARHGLCHCPMREQEPAPGHADGGARRRARRCRRGSSRRRRARSCAGCRAGRRSR